MKINPKVAVPRLFPENNTHFKMIYFEVIANALDAGATKIDIEIDFQDSEFKKFVIIDNGIGFNDEQYDCFSNLMKTKDNTHKGQGRLVYLVYFENIQIVSKFSSKSQIYKRSFDFNFDFQPENSTIVQDNNSETGTKLSFSKKLKKMQSLDNLRASHIREMVFAEFLPYFFEMKQKNNFFEINIKTVVDGSEEFSSISLKDIPEFQSIELDTSELTPSGQSENLLKNPKAYLYYYLKKDDTENAITSVITSFAIDNRAKKIDIVDEANYIPNVEAIFFLVSKHLEGEVDATRQELTLKQKELQHLQNVFRKYIKDIFAENFNEYQQMVDKRKDFVRERFPHLMDYIDFSKIGFQSNKDVIQQAQNTFFKEQREILEKDKDELSEEDYDKAIDLSAKNLTEYILFRQLQIERLKNISPEDKEKVIHNIISPMKNLYSARHNDDFFKNNAWILDDRFMTYIGASSDMTLKKITQEFNHIFNHTSNSENRPDYLMFFSNKITDKNDKVDLVCFEFKRLGETLENKTKALTELTKYTKELKRVCPEIQRVWLYALVDFDEELESVLEALDFKMKFSTQGKIWYQYYANNEFELSFLDFRAVVGDAESRNKTFMDILKKGFSYE